MISSGLPPFDQVVGGLRPGDHVVFRVDQLENYLFFARPFATNALKEGEKIIYFRFAPHPPLLEPQPELQIVEIDPHRGFDHFCSQMHQRIAEAGVGAFYVFDNLSALVEDWTTEELSPPIPSGK